MSMNFFSTDLFGGHFIGLVMTKYPSPFYSSCPMMNEGPGSSHVAFSHSFANPQDPLMLIVMTVPGLTW